MLFTNNFLYLFTKMFPSLLDKLLLLMLLQKYKFNAINFLKLAPHDHSNFS